MDCITHGTLLQRLFGLFLIDAHSFGQGYSRYIIKPLNMYPLSFLLCILLTKLVVFGKELSNYHLEFNAYSEAQIHPLTSVFLDAVERCGSEPLACSGEEVANITNMAAKITNEYSTILLQDAAQSLLAEAFYHIDPSHPLGLNLNHMQAVLTFASGDQNLAENNWKYLNESGLTGYRTLAAQMLMSGREQRGLELLKQYTQLVGERFIGTLERANMLNFDGSHLTLVADATSDQTSISSTHTSTSSSNNGNGEDKDIGGNGENSNSKYKKNKKVILRSSSVTETSEDLFLTFLFSEAQGNVRLHASLSDAVLSSFDIRPIDAQVRFRLGVGLAKLGLFDLSLKHVSISATPWENPLYRLRSRLSFPPIQGSVRDLAQAVDSFEQQGESLLLHKTSSSPISLMTSVCTSLNEAALLLQALPLLHLAGYSSPRHNLMLGHSPIALPVLLGEVLRALCPPSPIPISLSPLTENDERRLLLLNNGGDSNPSKKSNKKSKSKKKNSKNDNKLRIGFISGSFDGQPGHIVIGILEGITASQRENVIFTAMSFPTPRDSTTDRINALFDVHVNLNPLNKTQALSRIMENSQDLLIFTDAGMDSRSFALAHERLSPRQALLWGWGGTLGIPAIDFYIIPEALWKGSTCATVDRKLTGGERRSVLPQELFQEQTVILSGLPSIPSYILNGGSIQGNNHYPSLSSTLETRYLLPPQNSSHIFLIPCSVKQIHPEFDAAIAVLLRTDPLAIIVMAQAKTGRDNLPTMHTAVRHDLMHPTNPVAAVTKLKYRLRRLVGNEVARVRILPPIDPALFRALQRRSAAVLDPFPVGQHIPLMEALVLGIPVVSAPHLQECTNRHARGILDAFGIALLDGTEEDPSSDSMTGGSMASWPTTAEEFAVLAMQLTIDSRLRAALTPTRAAIKRATVINNSQHGVELINFAKNQT